MIRSLTGQIIAIGDGYITINVHGVGYLVGAPTNNTSFTLNAKTTLHTYLAVRETALDLYGFSTETELEVFELLLKVPKVGPKSALQILSQASPSLLLEAINKKDGQYLHKMSGIGKKTCENVVQFLHEKTDHIKIDGLESDTGISNTETDAIDALVALGYEINTARRTIKSLEQNGASTNELVTAALKQIQ